MKNSILKSILFISIAILWNGCCPSTALYDTAANSFSNGATLTMKKRFANTTQSEPNESIAVIGNIYPGSSAATSGVAAIHYGEAYSKINTALAKPECLNKSDVKLLGNALTIKALTEWQLAASDPSMFHQAEKTAHEAKAALLSESENSYIDDRDLSIMTAFHGIITIDTVHKAVDLLIERMNILRPNAASMTRTEANNIWNKLHQHYQLFISGEVESPYSIQFAFDQIDMALPVAKNHKDIELYLILCKLSGLRTWAGELDIINVITAIAGINEAGTTANTWIISEQHKFKEQRDAIMKALEINLLREQGQGKEAPVYKFFDRIM